MDTETLGPLSDARAVDCHNRPVKAVVGFSQARQHTDLVMNKEEFPDLTPELRVVLNEWDPLGVADLSPDEYDGLNGSVAGCLSRCRDLTSFAECFSNVASGFCSDSQEIEGVAAAIYFWFTSRALDPSSQPQLRKG